MITKLNEEKERVVKEKERFVKENRELQIKNGMNRKLSEEMVESALRFKLKDREEQELKKEVRSVFKELSNQRVLIAENEELKAQWRYRCRTGQKNRTS